MIKALIFDLDQTLIESHHVEYLRKTRNWPAVYREIPTIQAYDGINQLLLNAKEKDIELAIVTSSPESYVQRIIDHFDWFLMRRFAIMIQSFINPNQLRLLKR